MILIFKTNVSSRQEAGYVKSTLLKMDQHAKITFDLDDIDKVLRIESASCQCDFIQSKLAALGFQCEELT